ncbi:MAG: tRNA pseudouridine(55) synthase TruB [Bdellovibrionia bacterium]
MKEDSIHGALLIHKHAGVSSFGIIQELQRLLHAQKSGLKRKDLPKLGHGGTLDPFATGLLIVLIGRGVKLARYFLGSAKTYEGTMCFGATTEPGDDTAPLSERCESVPESLPLIQAMADQMAQSPYLQTPPMFSAKKQNGKPLYLLAREGIEVEREPKLCHLYDFQIRHYEKPQAQFQVSCSSGTYVRSLAQDLAKQLGSLAYLTQLHRTACGIFTLENALTTQQVQEALAQGENLGHLPCFVPFDRLLDGYPQAPITPAEKEALIQGKQEGLLQMCARAQFRSSPKSRSGQTQDCVALTEKESLVAVARRTDHIWSIERVFVSDQS